MAIGNIGTGMTSKDVMNWLHDEPPEPITSDFNGKAKCPGKWFQKHQWKTYAGTLKGDGLYWRVWRIECQLCGQWVQRPSKVGFAPHAGCLEYSPFHKGLLHYSDCEPLENALNKPKG